MIVMLMGELTIHSLQLRSLAEVEAVRQKVEKLIREALELPYESDVTFDIETRAGNPEPEGETPMKPGSAG